MTLNLSTEFVSPLAACDLVESENDIFPAVALLTRKAALLVSVTQAHNPAEVHRRIALRAQNTSNRVWVGASCGLQSGHDGLPSSHGRGWTPFACSVAWVDLTGMVKRDHIHDDSN